jgi:hypothetical protein
MRPKLIRALGRFPEPVKETLRHAFVGARVTSDARSLRTYIRLTRIAHHEGSGGRAVGPRLRPLGERTVFVRPSTSDVDTVWGTFARAHHRPPEELAGRPISLIFDLGANIGLTMADAAVRFPQARVVGVEVDAENVLLARANLAPWRDRCEVVHGAVWTSDTEVFYAPCQVTRRATVSAAPDQPHPPAPSASKRSHSTRCSTGMRRTAALTT